jgi:hypothetical protein
MLWRIGRDTAIACVALAVMFWLWRRTLAAPLGVLGGGLLIGLSSWAIWGGVDGWMRPKAGRIGQLVKFFTRYAMLALAAHGMLVRFELDPLGMLTGVSSLGVAVGLEALRKK